jgi:hypothetical protein
MRVSTIDKFHSWQFFIPYWRSLTLRGQNSRLLDVVTHNYCWGIPSLFYGVIHTASYTCSFFQEKERKNSMLFSPGQVNKIFLLFGGLNLCNS